MLTNEKLDKKILEFKQLEEKEIKETEEEKKIINSRNASDIYDFARTVVGAHIDKLEDAIIATGDAYYICEFARYIKKGKNIGKLEDGIIATGDAFYIFQFARYIKKGKDIGKLEDAIIAIGDAYYIYLFARDVKEAHIDKLEDAIIATGDAEYIYYFARDVKDANIKKLEDAIMETKNAKYICCFIQVMYGSSIIIDRDVRSIGTVEDTSEIDKLENMNIDQIEFDMILKKYDLKVIGEKLKNSFLNKLYFERKNYTLKYLIKNKELDINEIRLRIYFDYLNNPNSTEEDLEKCNEEYIRYISMFYDEKNKDEEDKNNVKVKKIQK